MGRIDAVDSAIRINAKDPEAHYTRGALLVNDDPAAANAETTQSVALRPRDYIFWLGLAQTRELHGDLSGAVIAAMQASELAPFYAQPRWRLGNLLVRAGRSDEGFRELRAAAATNPALLPSIIDLAWQLSHGDAAYVQATIQPNTPDARIALSEYFRSHGKMIEAAELINNAGPSADRFRRQLLNQLISEKRFADAHRMWAGVHGISPDARDEIFDPSFEQGSDFQEPGFGWRAADSQRVTLAVSQENPAEGKASLRITFNGESDPALAILSQTVMVDPGIRFRLTFAGRSEQLVSGGLPMLRVFDAASGAVLGESVLKQQTDGWLDYGIEFETPASSSTIEIRIQRQSCTTSPCPIFGTLWLDRFSLQKR